MEGLDFIKLIRNPIKLLDPIKLIRSRWILEGPDGLKKCNKGDSHLKRGPMVCN